MLGRNWFKLLAALVVLGGLLFAAGSPVAARMLAEGTAAPGRLQARPVSALESLISTRVTDDAAAPSVTVTRGQDSSAQTTGPAAEPAAAREFEFTGVVTSLPPGPWVIAGRTLLTNTQTEIKPGVVLGGQAKVHAIPQAGGSLLAREIEPAEAADLDDDTFEITGTVTSVTGNVWVIGGQTVQVNDDTEIDAGLGVGSTVKAEGSVQADGTLLAREIKSLDEDDAAGEDDDQGEGDDEGQDGDDDDGDDEGQGGGDDEDDDSGPGGGDDDGDDDSGSSGGDSGDGDDDD